MSPQITDYINSAGEQKALLEKLRQLIHEAVPHATEEFKWGRPVFRTNRDFAYLKTAKKYVTLGFFDFEKLHDPGNLLEGTGKQMRHIKLTSTSDINSDLLTEWLKTASA